MALKIRRNNNIRSADSAGKAGTEKGGTGETNAVRRVDSVKRTEVKRGTEEAVSVKRAELKEKEIEWDENKETVTTAEESFESVAKVSEEEEIFGSVTTVSEEDGIFLGYSETEVSETKTTEILGVANEDLGNMDVASAETDYKVSELHKEAAPIIQDTVGKEVSKAVKLNNERLKLEVNEVLADEVGYRLDKYEKRRKFRQRKDFVVGVLKAVAVLVVVLFIFGNTQLRTRFQIVFADIGDMVHGLMNNEEVTSNQLVEDMFKDMGDELNDVNSKTIIVEEE